MSVFYVPDTELGHRIPDSVLGDDGKIDLKRSFLEVLGLPKIHTVGTLYGNKLARSNFLHVNIIQDCHLY